MSIAERTTTLLDGLRAGDGQALGELFMLYRDRLWRMLYVRLDRRLASRVAPDDVLQETFLDVSRRIGEYLSDPAVPFYVWLRFLTIQRMQIVQRTHLGAANVRCKSRSPACARRAGRRWRRRTPWPDNS